MNSNNTINKIYSEWWRCVTSTPGFREGFSILSRDEDRVAFILGLPQNENFERFGLFLDTIGKNSTTSIKMRQLGNKMYTAAQYDQALKCYCESIAYATNNSQELTFALGNRAACLLNLGYIADALIDIHRALQISTIDTDYREKLLRRQEVCMNKIIECKDSTKKLPLPEFEGNNDYFDSTCDQVLLSENEDRGRYLVAKSCINTGNVVMVENPYCSVLLPSSFYSHCRYCLLRAYAMIECSNCATALYCSTECLNKDKQVHIFECQIIERLVLLEIGKMDFLALRILINALCNGNNLKSLISFDSISNKRYKSQDLCRIYNLVGNTEKRTFSDLLKRTFIACVIVKAVEKFTSLFEECSVTTCLAGGFLLHFLQSLPCNAHEISEVIDGEAVEIGAGAFATLSLLNHSCEPNVVRHSNGSTVVLRAIRPIKQGEEILDNYGYHYATHELSERQSSLMGQYYFQCQCEACVGKWPLYGDLPSSSPKLKSPENSLLTFKYLEMTRKFEEYLGLVLANNISYAVIDYLCSYLDFLDNYVKRPWQDFNKCQEAIKHGLNFLHDFNRRL